MYNKVRKEMPGLSPAAWRREAARRMGTEYETFLDAWKKPGPPKTPVDNPVPAPVPKPEPAPGPRPPAPGELTYEAARAEYTRQRKMNPNGSPAQWRRDAANELGVDYKQYTKVWKTPKKEPSLSPVEPAAPIPKPGGALPASTEAHISKLAQQMRDSMTQLERKDLRFRSMRKTDESKRKVERALNRMARAHPRVFESINKVRMYTNDDTHAENAWADYNLYSHEMRLGQTPLQSDATIKMIRMQRQGWWVPGHKDAVTNTMSHEMGHGVDAMLGRGDRMQLLDMVAAYFDDPGPIAFALNVSSEQAFRPSLDQWFDTISGKVRKVLSQYGASNHFEMLAEVWCEYSADKEGCRPFAKKIGAAMEAMTS